MFFLCLQNKSFENTLGKGGIARNKQFILFYPFRKLSTIFIYFRIVICKLFQFGILKFVVWEWVKRDFQGILWFCWMGYLGNSKNESTLAFIMPPFNEVGVYCFAHVGRLVGLSVGIPNLFWMITWHRINLDLSNLAQTCILGCRWSLLILRSIG